MPVVVREKPDSRTGTETTDAKDRQRGLQYTVTGTFNVGEAVRAVAADAPPFFDGMPLKGFTWDELGEGVWEFTASYDNRDSGSDSGSEAIEFDTSGGTAHITQAKEALFDYWNPALTDAPPNFRGAIGVTESSVEGCDITVPVFTFTKRKIMRGSQVTNAYVNQIFRLTGKTNAAPFMGMFARYEVLFLGAQGSRQSREDWQISFKFAASPNVTGLSVGAITGIAKGGWEYLWVRHRTDTDSDAKIVTQVPLSVHVVRVYDEGDFGVLGLTNDLEFSLVNNFTLSGLF